MFGADPNPERVRNECREHTALEGREELTNARKMVELSRPAPSMCSLLYRLLGG